MLTFFAGICKNPGEKSLRKQRKGSRIPAGPSRLIEKLLHAVDFLSAVTLEGLRGGLMNGLPHQIQHSSRGCCFPQKTGGLGPFPAALSVMLQTAV